MTTASTRLPVTVVTGFLGAGKTTVLRHLLLHSGQRLAVLVNEFGEVGIDGALLRACGFCPEDELDGRLVELANGCLCCTVQDDFLPTMERLLERADDLDGIVVETSGLALPEPLVAAFQWPAIRTRTRVHGVVTVVDGEALAHGHVVADAAALEAQRQADPSLEHLDAIEDLFDDQLQAADVLLISRADRLAPEQLETLHQALSPRVRPGTAVLPCAAGVVDPELLLGRRLETGDASERLARLGHGEHHDHDDPHDHHDHSHVAIESVALTLTGTWQQQQLEQQLRQLMEQGLILRLKGWLAIPGKPRLLQIQAVGPRLQTWFEGSPSDGSGALHLVVLGFGLDRDRITSMLLSVQS
ncbi:MAG: cobalamin biosynthesis protein CobW [Cyanobacteria bacterium K_DeepCast_35m_m2_023]|nr:cobalamin biosynthesis protein CobW [Cyanobacteria bacterium K_DeepCast_35m_m2_023]